MRFLGDQHVNVAQVGFMLHFADESAFQRAFKRWTSQTPGQYRRRTIDRAQEPALPSISVGRRVASAPPS